MVNSSDTTPAVLQLQQMAHALSSAFAKSHVLQIMLRQTVAALGARGVVARLLSPEGDELIPVGALGLNDSFYLSGRVDTAHNDLVGRVLAGEVVVIPDIAQEPLYPDRESARRHGLKGVIAVPMQVRARVLGVLCIYLNTTHEPNEQELLLASALADLGALALEKVNLHQSLLHIAAALNSTLDLQPMLEQLLQATVTEMQLKAASVRLLDPKQNVLRLVAAYGLGRAYLDKGNVHVGRSPVDQSALRGEPIVLFDVETEIGFEYPQEATHEGIRSVLVVPLKLKERSLGVMRVYSVRPRHFSPVSIQFVSSVAGLVALAIENAELHAALKAHVADLELDLAEWHRFLALG
jgi:GAF domain-containing protein